VLPALGAAGTTGETTEEFDLRPTWEALAQDPGFLGLKPEPERAAVVAFYTQADPVPPAAVPLPAGWTLETVGSAAWSPASLSFPETGVQDLHESGGDGLPPTPEMAEGLGPGTKLLISVPEEPGIVALCTANFLWQDKDGRLYLGTAGHCLLPKGKVATHGYRADYDASKVRVRACYTLCAMGGESGFIVQGYLVDLGPVAYARQTGPGGDLGNDFGIVRIPTSLHSAARAQVPVWGGPHGMGYFPGDLLDLDREVLHYGNGKGWGETPASRARVGFAVIAMGINWQAAMLASAGDSGSPVLSGKVDTDGDVLRGEDALGILTHALEPAGGLGGGTTIQQARGMAREAGITLTLVEAS